MRTCLAIILLVAAVDVANTPTKPPPQYANYYNAIVTSVHDGDSFTCDTDLGRKVWLHDDKTRLSGLNAPELSEPGGPESRDWLKARINGKPVVLQTEGDDDTGKYGRILVTVWMRSGRGWTNINSELVAAGHAELREY